LLFPSNHDGQVSLAGQIFAAYSAHLVVHQVGVVSPQNLARRACQVELHLVVLTTTNG
jgi:hypothetical protein